MNLKKIFSILAVLSLFFCVSNSAIAVVSAEKAELSEDESLTTALTDQAQTVVNEQVKAHAHPSDRLVIWAAREHTGAEGYHGEIWRGETLIHEFGVSKEGKLFESDYHVKRKWNKGEHGRGRWHKGEHGRGKWKKGGHKHGERKHGGHRHGRWKKDGHKHVGHGHGRHKKEAHVHTITITPPNNTPEIGASAGLSREAAKSTKVQRQRHRHRHRHKNPA